MAVHLAVTTVTERGEHKTHHAAITMAWIQSLVLTASSLRGFHGHIPPNADLILYVCPRVPPDLYSDIPWQ